jgi:acyl-CoA synthetase (AMP-forming)/AMP-acid ligase II
MRPAALLEIPVNADETIVDVLSRQAERRRGQTCFAFAADAERAGGSCTFDGLHAVTQVLARSLGRQGLYRRRVLLVYPPGLDFVGTFFACLCAGVVAVPVVLPRSAAEGGHLLRVALASGASLIFTDSRTQRALGSAWEGASSAATRLVPLEWPRLDPPVALRREPRTLPPRLQDLAYLRYAVDSTGLLRCQVFDHGTLLARYAGDSGSTGQACVLNAIVASVLQPEPEGEIATPTPQPARRTASWRLDVPALQPNNAHS